MSMKLVKIVTHHENPNRATEIYLKEKVIAVGYVYDKTIANANKDRIKKYFRKERGVTEQQVGEATSTFLRFRDEIKKRDVVFAYAGNNRVALVGEVIGECRFNDRNIVGDEKGEIGYPNQRRMKWWANPRNFDGSFLPSKLSQWVAKPRTLSFFDQDAKKLKEILQKIPSQEAVTIALEIHGENETKDYIEKNPEAIEEGLSIIERECQTLSGPMDFLAKDKNGIYTVMEVKMEADDTTVTQIRKYIQAFKSNKKVAKVRGIIVAEDFKKSCIEDTAELTQLGFNLNLYKCKKTFNFAKLL